MPIARPAECQELGRRAIQLDLERVLIRRTERLLEAQQSPRGQGWARGHGRECHGRSHAAASISHSRDNRGSRDRSDPQPARPCYLNAAWRYRSGSDVVVVPTRHALRMWWTSRTYRLNVSRPGRDGRSIVTPVRAVLHDPLWRRPWGRVSDATCFEVSHVGQIRHGLAPGSGAPSEACSGKCGRQDLGQQIMLHRRDKRVHQRFTTYHHSVDDLDSTL